MSGNKSLLWLSLKWLSVILSMFVWFGGGFIDLYQSCTDHVIISGLTYLILPFGLYLIVIYINVSIFPLRYSFLGNTKRTLHATGPCGKTFSAWTHIGHISISYAKWAFYLTGFGLKVPGLKEIFIDWRLISSVKSTWWGSCVIVHDCEEVRSPIVGPSMVRKIVDGYMIGRGSTLEAGSVEEVE